MLTARYIVHLATHAHVPGTMAFIRSLLLSSLYRQGVGTGRQCLRSARSKRNKLAIDATLLANGTTVLVLQCAKPILNAKEPINALVAVRGLRAGGGPAFYPAIEKYYL